MRISDWSSDVCSSDLNPKVVQFMKSIFDDIADDVTVDGASVLVDAGPGSAYEQLFRARVFQSERSLIDALQHPERFIGAPLADIGARDRKSTRLNSSH